MMKKILAALFALTMSCTAVQAATFDFTDIDKAKTSGTLTYSSGGINLKVSSARHHDPHGSAPLGVYGYGKIGQSKGNGLYIDVGLVDNHEIDGRGPNEVAMFEFDQSVTIESVSFTHVDSDDTFSFFYDDHSDGILTNDEVDLNIDIPGSGDYSFNDAFISSLFGIGANDGSCGWFSCEVNDFKIASITVNTISAVPLPAALPLYGAGMAIIGFLGWRRKST